MDPLSEQFVEEFSARLVETETAVNVTFVLLVSIIIFFMQTGFAFLEAGSVRAKNTTNILVKNIIDAAIGSMVYWATGYAFAFGNNKNEFIGTDRFFLINTPSEDYAGFFFQYVFAVTSATIVSGAIAERTHLIAYWLFTSLMTGFIYPVVSHWVWSDNGWLANLNYVDFAGSSVVHAVGGTASLVGTLMVGPRIGRFEGARILPIPGHSTVLVTLGFFILWFGFFAFNGGSEGGIAGPDYDPNAVSRAVVNTALSGGAGVLVSMFILKLGFKKDEFQVYGKEFKMYTIFGGYWSLCGGINGGLCGMVAICAGCNIVEPWAGFVIGCVAGAAYCFWSRLLLELHIDDPVNAVPVHLGGGIWGCLAAVIFANSDRLDQLPEGGILYGGNADAFILFGVQCIGLAVIITWVAFCTFIIFSILKLLDMLRVTATAEEDGLDYINGEPAYPIDPAILDASAYDSDTSDSDEILRT